MAKRIIEFRKTHTFQTLKDLLLIPGIGQRTLELIKPYIQLESGPMDKEKKSEKIDPNVASQKELESLPKIGPAMAKRIIEYRKTHTFSRPEDLLSVPGIGEKTLQLIKPHLSLQNVSLEQLHTFGTCGRDPRGRQISIVFVGIAKKGIDSIKAGDDAAKAQWFDIENLPEDMAFDHNEVVKFALKKLNL